MRKAFMIYLMNDPFFARAISWEGFPIDAFSYLFYLFESK